MARLASIAAVVAALAAAPAYAACPTPADLAAGVVLEGAGPHGGRIVHMRTLDAETLWWARAFGEMPGGVNLRIEHRMMGLVRLYEQKSSDPVDYTFAYWGDLSPLLPPAPGKTAELTGTLSRKGFDARAKVELVLTLGDPATIQIGDCRYPAHWVTFEWVRTEASGDVVPYDCVAMWSPDMMLWSGGTCASSAFSIYHSIRRATAADWFG